MRRSVDDYQNPAGDEAQQLSRIDGEETPLDLIVAFKPDLLVKGADY
jgi:bifunctional ADP-heptose synthase (sugar kinase/adenylyltransferase)